MRILVVGGGGREHALCRAIAASPLVDALYCAPGNAGIAREAECVPIPADAVDPLVVFVLDSAIDLVVVGPEVPLVAGLVDRLRHEGILAFGPTAAAAELEASKGFAKDLCAKYGIPTAAYRRFRDAGAANAWVREQGAPIVIKADGLAAGKGVTVAATVTEAEAAVDAALSGAFGDAGAEIVVEECMTGEELSFFALVDGKTALPLAGAQDHKAVGERDTGPNTGGMGAYSPAPVLTPELHRRIMAEIMDPAVAAMAAEGRPYTGVLYAGLMITAQGPKVIEFNVRFGDPEAQVLLPRLRSDLVPALVAACKGQLDHVSLRWSDDVALSVVMATRGYPGSYEKGSAIRGLEAVDGGDDIQVFHAGTKFAEGRIVADGGRVLNVTAIGPSVAEARRRAYAAVDGIDWPQGFCRRDIGHRAVARES